MDYNLRDGWVSLNYNLPAWKFIPLAELFAYDSAVYRAGGLGGATFDYFFRAFRESKINGSVGPYYITADKPTVWQFEFSFPDDKTVHHFEVEHIDLSPAKIAEVINAVRST